MAFKDFVYPTSGASPYLATGEKKLHTSSDYTQSEFYFYTVKNGGVNVKADLTYQLPANCKFAELPPNTEGLPNFSCQTPQITSVRPSCVNWQIKDGEVYISDPNNLSAATLKFHDSASSGALYGQDWSDVDIHVPDPFGQVGKGGFCQLFTGDRLLHRITGPGFFAKFIKDPWNGIQTLDVSCPIPLPFSGGQRWH
jgi:hypothetical protein